MTPRRPTILPDALKNFVLDAFDPVADWLIRAGLKPNRITTLSVFVLLASGGCFAVGELRWAAVLLLFSGVLDLLDGKVARRGGMASPFGAFYDSTMDRVGEALLYMGIATYFVSTGGQRWPVLGLLLCFGALSCSFVVSYARAKAEALGLDATVGIAQRAERIVLLAGPTLFFHAGPHGLLLLGILSFLFITSAITVVQRIVHVYHQTVPAAPGPESRATHTAEDSRESAPAVVPATALKGT